MNVSSKTDPEMLRREADECTELLSRATFIGIIAVLMEYADTCRIMADRIVEAQRRPSGAEWGQVLAGAELKKTGNARREG